MNRDDVRPWSAFVNECVVNLIWRGADLLGRNRYFLFFFIESQWKSWSDLLERWVSVHRRSRVDVSEEALKSIKL